MMGFQWNPKDLEDAKAAVEKKSSSLETFNTPPIKQETEKTTGQPAGMAGMEGRSLRPPRSPEAPAFYQPPVGDKKVRYIPPTQEKTLPGQKAPVIVPKEGNPEIPAGYTDKTTKAKIDDTLPKPAAHPVMYQAPSETTQEPRHPVQIGMKPPVPPQQI